MLTISKPNEELLDLLERDLYRNLNILYFLQSNPNVRVYSLNEDYTRGVFASYDDDTSGFYFAASYDVELIETFLKNAPLEHIMFSGVPIDMMELIIKGHNIIWENPCKTYVYDVDMPFIAVSNEYSVEELKISDAETVDEFYTYKGEGSLDMLRADIERGPTACIRIGGKLASWCLVHGTDGSMGPMYTLGEYRKQGLAVITANALVGKLYTAYHTPYVQIVTTNAPALKLIEKLPYMKYTHDCTWFGLSK